MSRDWKRELFKQKSLWQVYWVSLRILPRSRGNTRIVLGILLLVASTQLVAYFLPDRLYRIEHTAEFVHSVSDASFVFALSVLGFLIAGFSIFASITRVELFIALANIPYRKHDIETGLNRLQFIFFNFINVFSVYFVLLAMTLFLGVGYSNGSPLRTFGSLLALKYPDLCMVVNIVASSAFLVVLAEAVLRLKSFIWNLYQSVLLVIVTSDEIATDDDRKMNR